MRRNRGRKRLTGTIDLSVASVSIQPSRALPRHHHAFLSSHNAKRCPNQAQAHLAKSVDMRISYVSPDVKPLQRTGGDNICSGFLIALYVSCALHRLCARFACALACQARVFTLQHIISIRDFSLPALIGFSLCMSVYADSCGVKRPRSIIFTKVVEYYPIQPFSNGLHGVPINYLYKSCRILSHTAFQQWPPRCNWGERKEPVVSPAASCAKCLPAPFHSTS
jgi:hypothetical protein